MTTVLLIVIGTPNVVKHHRVPADGCATLAKVLVEPGRVYARCEPIVEPPPREARR